MLWVLVMGCRGETEKITPWQGWTRTEVDETTLARWDGVIETWEVGPEWSNWFPTLLGDNRRFRVARGKEVVDRAPVLFALHGSGIDDDSPGDYYEGDPEDTICGAARDIAAAYLDPLNLVSVLALAEDWVVVAPEGLWCDGWHGQGPKDPGDPQNHFGFVHLEEVIRFVDDGGLGVNPSRRMAWGSSSGGGAAVLAEAWVGGFDRLVVDSAPCNWLAYYRTDPDPVTHLFGGPPWDEEDTATGLFESYEKDSCHNLTQGLNTPIFQAWNQHDRLVPGAHGLDLSKALPAGSVTIDHQRFAPGDSYHTQTRTRTIPMGYMPGLAQQFLDGASMAWVEAELACLDCKPEVDSVAGGVWSDFSGAGGVLADHLTIEVPTDVPEGEVTAVLLVQLVEQAELTLTVGEATHRATNLVVGEEDEIDAILRHTEQTRVTFEHSKKAVLDITTTAAVRFDAVAFLW